jgi:hypothetical protein
MPVKAVALMASSFSYPHGEGCGSDIQNQEIPLAGLQEY